MRTTDNTDHTDHTDHTDYTDNDRAMTNHLTEDELVLHYYGELTASDGTLAAKHLSACSQCHDNLRRLQRVLALVDETAVAAPELPEHFERTVWARLEPNLHRSRGGWRSWFVLPPGRVAALAMLTMLTMMVLLIGAAFMAGRLVPRATPVTVATTADQLREGILLVDVGDHLDRSQMMLVELLSADDENPVDISGERARAEQLVAANRLYRQTAVSTGDTGIADLLDELERLLVNLAASPEQLSATELSDLRRQIESRSLLFKVRVVSADIRQRQKAIVLARAQQLASL
jgi:hypothetical protein